MSKTEGKRSDILLETKPKLLVSFPNFSCWKQIDSILSRICSPGQNRKDHLRKEKIRKELNGFFVSFLIDIGTFVERLWNVCSFTVLTLLIRIRIRIGLKSQIRIRIETNADPQHYFVALCIHNNIAPSY
jgi:hypothetical protein